MPEPRYVILGAGRVRHSVFRALDTGGVYLWCRDEHIPPSRYHEPRTDRERALPLCRACESAGGR